MDLARRRDSPMTCRYCGYSCPESFMFNRWVDADGDHNWDVKGDHLWGKIAPRDIPGSSLCHTESGSHSGWVCLTCLVNRVPGRRLYREDFNQTVPDIVIAESGHEILFPSRKGGKRVTVKRTVWANNPYSSDEAFEEFFAGIAWLEDYCEEAGLELWIDGLRYFPMPKELPEAA